MNDRSEIFGSCKCKTKFHRFKRKNAQDTEDGCKNPEKFTEPTVPEEDPFVSPVFSITDSQISVTPKTLGGTSSTPRMTDSARARMTVDDDGFNLMSDFDTEEISTVDV